MTAAQGTGSSITIVCKDLQADRLHLDEMRKVAAIVLSAVLGAAGWFTWALLTPLKPSSQTFVMLRPGYSTRRIAKELKQAGVIRSEQAFLLWHYYHHARSLKAGEYVFAKAANIVEVQQRLRRGDIYFRTVVVPEGFTMFDIARAIEAAGLGPADQFVEEARSDTALIADIAPEAHSLEGYLFPETYEFSRMMSMHDMAAAMVKQFRQVARESGLISEASPPAVWDTPSPQSGITPSGIERVVIMASIIEKETALPDERPLVASVYYNRLDKNMPLAADPSIIYAELLAGAYQGALHHADMSFSSPYNTYRNGGLPPGPIGNPGRSALDAAMHPAQTDYLYFVADGEGHHRFARTIVEHNKNVAEYRRAMRGR
jgi:UPF0755 protein